MPNTELNTIAENAFSAATIRTPEDFEAWCQTEVRRFLPYGTLLCAAGQIHAGLVVIDALHAVDYPKEYLAQIKRQVPLQERRVIQDWISTRQPQVVSADVAKQLIRIRPSSRKLRRVHAKILTSENE